MNFVPMNKTILLRESSKAKASKGGTLFPDTFSDGTFVEAIVEAVSTDSSLNVGDFVLLSYQHGQPIKIEGEQYILADEDRIVGKLSESHSPSVDQQLSRALNG